jgi:hypothetical protein
LDNLIASLYNNLKEKKLPVSLIEYGSRKSKKYSDIDLMVVLNGACSLQVLHKEIMDFTQISGQFNGGNVILIDHRQFKNINYVDDIKVSASYGPNVEIKSPSKSDCEIRDHLSLIDWIPERIGRLDYLLSQGEINETSVVGVLYSLGHSFRVASKTLYPGKIIHWEQIQNLRNNLEKKNINKREKIVELYEYLRPIAISIVNASLTKIYPHQDLKSQKRFNYTNLYSIQISQHEFHQNLLLHLSLYNEIFFNNNYYINFKLENVHEVDLKGLVGAKKIMQHKADTLKYLDLKEIYSLRGFSPLRFGYLLSC